MEITFSKSILFAVAMLGGAMAAEGMGTSYDDSLMCPEWIEVYPWGDDAYTVERLFDTNMFYLSQHFKGEDGEYLNGAYYVGHSRRLWGCSEFYSIAIKDKHLRYTEKRRYTEGLKSGKIMYEYCYGENRYIREYDPDEFTAALESKGAQTIDQVKLMQPYCDSDELIARGIDNLGNYYIFVSHDFGDTWKLADTDARIEYVQWSESNPNVVYGVELSRGTTMTLLVSDDRGESWTVLDEVEYHYNTVVPYVKEININVNVCPSRPDLVLVSCFTPFVYDRSNRTTTFLACSPRVPGPLQNEAKYNARRYGFTNSATPQIMTFDTDEFCLKLSDDLGQTWRECLDMNGKPVFRGSTQGWARKGNIVYALTYKSSQCAYGTMYLIDLNETDAMAGVETTPDDAVIAGVRVTTSGDAIIVHADTETDIAVYSVDGKLVSRHDDVTDATIPVIPGIYIVQAAGVARKVRL